MMKRSVTLLVFAGVLCACGNLSHEDSGIRSVVLTKPVVLDSVCVVNYPGIVREAHTISLGFKTAGQIERIHVREGDYVRKGDLLAGLDDADYRLGVEALQIQYNQVKDEVDRMERLFGQKSISANDYEKAVAGLKQLGVQLQVSKNKLAYTRLYAPINGYIQRVNFSPAEMVDAGTALFTLLDVSQMEVVADIPLNEYKQRDYFIRYYCKAVGVVGELPMTLLGFTPKADGNQLYQLRLTFEEYPDEQITAGMNVEVGIVVKDTASALKIAVPMCTIFCDNSQGPCVWVFGQDSVVSKQPVVLDGIDDEGRAVVVGGLTGKECIVRAGVHVLRDGERVRVVEKTSKTNVGGLL